MRARETSDSEAGAISSILGAMQHTFVVADPTLPDCPLVFASDSFLRLTGYTAEEILGQNCRFLQGEDTDHETVKELRQAVDRGEPITARLLNYKKSGEPFWNLLTMTPVRSSTGKVTKIIGVQIDITQSSCVSGALTFDPSVAEDAGQVAISDVTSGLHKLDQSSTAAATAAKLGAASILGAMQHTFVVADPTLPDCPLVFASDSFLRLTGYTAEEILGQNCRFLQGEDTDRETVKELRQAVDKGEPITARLLNYKKSGEPFWNLLTMTPVRSSTGKVTKIIGVQIDITQSSCVSGALTFDPSVAEDAGQAAISDVTSGLHKLDQSSTAAATAAKLGAASILGAMQHTFVVADPTLPDCPLVFASDSFLRLTGYTAEEILGQNCRFLQGEDTDHETVKELRQAVDRGEPITARLLNYKKSGEPFWNLLTMTPVRSSTGKVTKIIGVQVDITQNSEQAKDSSKLQYNASVKKDVSSAAVAEITEGISGMEAAKRKASLFGSAALSSMQHTFVVADPTLPDCPLVFASDSFCRLTGYTAEEILGQNCRFLQGEDTDQETVKRLGAAVRDGMPITARLLNYKKSGEPFWNLLTMTPVRSSTGKVTKIIGVQVNITQEDSSAPEGILSYNLSGKQNEGPLASQEIAKCLKTNGVVSFSLEKSPLAAALIKAGTGMESLVEEPEKVPLLQRLSQQLTRSPQQQNSETAAAAHAKRAKQKRASRVPRVAIDLASTVERLEHAFVVCDPGMEECPIVFVHDAFAKMTGYSKEKVLGQHPSRFMGTKGDKSSFNLLKTALTKGEEATIQLYSYRRSGERFLSQLYTCPMKDADGTCRFLVVVLVDLSKPAAVAEEEEEGEPEYVPDAQEMAEAMKGVMQSEVEEGHNPFEAIDAVSGIIRTKHHASEDRGYILLKKATKKRTLQLADLRMVKELGNGACGAVSMVELGGTGHCYALKSIDKEDMIQRNKVHRVVAEDFILGQIDHPLLALCYCTISTPTHIHYLLQHCEGGDLYRLLNKQGQLKESHARFYAAEILMSLKYLHLLGFVYRDLKPENVLLLHGHAILSDFDLACTRGATVPRLEQCGIEDDEDAQPLTGRRWACGMGAKASGNFVQRLRSQTMFVANPQMRSNSFVGTEEYLAPEVILGKGHSPAVDWWSYGIMLYELVFGVTPFRGNSQDESFRNIVENPLEFPKHEEISPALTNLITGLLTKNSVTRLGTANGAEEIQQHPFFEGVQWSLLRHQKPSFRTSGSRNSSLDGDTGKSTSQSEAKGPDSMSYNY